MSYPVRFVLRCLPLVIFALACVQTAEGQEKKLKDLKWSHAFDLACRKYKEADITKETTRWGVEAFRDDNTGEGVYISQVGSIAVAGHFANLTLPIVPSKRAEWLTGLDLPARKAGEKEFSKTTAVYSMEVFRDPNTDNWLFITEQGQIAATNGKLFPGQNNKPPKWVHSVDLQVRKGGVKEWTNAAKIGIEVYRDDNTKNLVYITEGGKIAIIPEFKDGAIGKGLAPEWLHGLDLSCRKFDEKSFGKDTRKFGVEVYADRTTGNLIFISETGNIAVTTAPADLKAPTSKVQQPEYLHGLNLKCREYGEKEFSEKTRSFGAELFRDPNLDVNLYIDELGAISVLSAK